MQHPSENFIKVELAALFLAMIVLFIAVIKNSFLGLLATTFLIAISLFCHGIVAVYFHNQLDAIKQIIRSCLLIIIGIVLLFKG